MHTMQSICYKNKDLLFYHYCTIGESFVQICANFDISVLVHGLASLFFFFRIYCLITVAISSVGIKFKVACGHRIIFLLHRLKIPPF